MQTDELTDEDEDVELSDYEKEGGKPMPNIIHGAVQAQLIARLLIQAGDQFRVVGEATLDIPQAPSLTPDLAIMPKRPLNWGREPARCKEVPVTVVEIVSPSQGYKIIVDKIDIYFAHGVRSVWEVNPALRLIAIHQPGGQIPQIIQQGEVRDPATGLSVRVEEIFS